MVRTKNLFGFKPGIGLLICLAAFVLSGCSSSSSSRYQGRLPDPIYTMAQLSEQQYQWGGTPYILGGNSQRGVDCSGFVMRTFADRFDISLPRTTAAQAKEGVYIERGDLQTGDLVFFKTGRGPNGYHVGIYVKDDQFLHASTKGGVIYSSLNSTYWKKAYWQARRV
ncbi:NlpC/P60 family protein [Testudinibacter sp. TR-2022]|uniref:NlpC/P60 family protein n=1 Tax=Testudinibacter sp. TR-2022 TaxID=2585029 RepID=UPI001119BDDB|nr:NlpC/P60 family protein [Testudinibacter sp. TR-2022]TNH03594.1 endopeptidase [Pasteurellaceae bacterium Phil11]TNH22342.1 endopeptidase [Testudinibacter sp. TR-2022]TNH26090.1 endopeptidase [Testudinibacter sp. TR-2022]